MQNKDELNNIPSESGSYGAHYQGDVPPCSGEAQSEDTKNEGASNEDARGDDLQNGGAQNNGARSEVGQSNGSYSGGVYSAPTHGAPVALSQPKGVPLYAVIAIILITAVLTFQITSVWFNLNKSDKNGLPSYFDSVLTIDEYLRAHYIGELDEERLSHVLAAAMLYASGDAYAYYYTPEEYAEEYMSHEGNAVGIGVLVTLLENGYIEILRVFKDAPADKAMLKRGDILIAVNGADIAEAGYENTLNAIQGEIGSTVDITVKRGEESFTVTVTREEYVQQTVYSHVYKDGATQKKLGVIKIYSFNAATTTQFKEQVNELLAQGVEGLIFDVRDNPGGTLDSVTEMLDFLLPEGKIVRITDKNGNEVHSYSSDKSCIDLPMAVLTNEDTASAAELFTSALKDYDKAISVGTRSYGKGTMQIMIKLADGSAFKFSYRYYSPPISDNYNGIGIFPEIELEPPEGVSANRLNDENDTQLAAAAEYLITGKLPA